MARRLEDEVRAKLEYELSLNAIAKGNTLNKDPSGLINGKLEDMDLDALARRLVELVRKSERQAIANRLWNLIGGED
jgi:hypothetical protein